MGKGIHARLRVVIHFTVHTIHHTRCAGGRSNFTRVEHVERQSIVRLVTTPISYRCTFLQAQVLGCPCIHTALFGESRLDVRYQRTVEAIIIHQEANYLVLLEIPEHTFRQTGNRCTDGTAQLHGDIVTRQHDFIDLCVDFRFVFLHPCQLAGGEVTRRVQQMRQAVCFAQCLERLLTIWNGTGVAPDDGRTQHLLVLVHTHQTVHLIRDTDGIHFISLRTTFSHYRLGSQFQVLPPILRVLFCPTRLYSHNLGFCLRIKCRSYTFSSFGMNQTGFDRRTANIVT